MHNRRGEARKSYKFWRRITIVWCGTMHNWWCGIVMKLYGAWVWDCAVRPGGGPRPCLGGPMGWTDNPLESLDNATRAMGWTDHWMASRPSSRQAKTKLFQDGFRIINHINHNNILCAIQCHNAFRILLLLRCQETMLSMTLSLSGR